MFLMIMKIKILKNFKKQNDIFLDKLKNIFKKLSKKEPLYNEIRESVLIQIAVEEIENDQSILYKCQM